MADAYFDHVVVGKISFKDTGEVVSPAAGVKGLATAPAGTPLPVNPQTAPGTVTAANAGATYTSAEQALINSLKAQLNSLISTLKTSGHLK